MKDYKNYNLEDFLLDDSFKNWVLGKDISASTRWENIGDQYPEKQVVISQARDLILTWTRQQSALTQNEIESQITRILKSTGSKKTALNTGIRWKWWSAAASMVLALGFGWKVWQSSKGAKPFTYSQYVGNTLVPLRELSNTTDKTMKIILSDGSIVELAPGGKVSYGQPFVKDKKREIYLQGEAFFKVTKDVQNPFLVYANGLLTRVVGTCFLVKTTGEHVKVLVRSGRVSVTPMKDIGNQKKRNTELLLTPNQQAIFSATDNLISKSITEVPVYLSESGVLPDFNFENQPISKVFATLEKVYGIPLIYDNAVLNTCYLRVKLTDEPFFTKLDIICQTIGASYRVSDGLVIITSEGCP
jgi:transmembrane sensor